MATIVEHRKFSCTELGNNHNKYWNVTLYDNGDVTSEWGRQGKTKQVKTWSGVGASFMEKKIKEKNKKGYYENQVVEGSNSKISTNTVANTELKDIASKQIKSKNPIVAKLIDFLVEVNAHSILKATGGQISFDTSQASFKTTQGIVLPVQVSRARNLLAKLYDGVIKGNYIDNDFEENLNEYLSLIPRDFGMKRLSPSDILPDISVIQKENDILDGLEASFAGLKTVTPKKDTKKDSPQIFDVEMEIVEDKKIFDRINSYYNKTKRSMHNSCCYKLHKIYTIDINTVKLAFVENGSKIGNIKELFHGSKCSNILSILRQGLIIPPASSSHCTGRLGGNGIYGSDISSKALNYATSFWGVGGRTDRIFMFLCDFAMGNMYYSKGYGDFKTPKEGYDSTFMEGGKYGLCNNEMIVYRTNQVNLKYLLEFNR